MPNSKTRRRNRPDAEPGIDLERLTPTQRRLLGLMHDPEASWDTAVWVGAIRSGKGVGAALGLMSYARAMAGRHGAGLEHLICGQTVGGFLRNNEAYLLDAAALLGMQCQYRGGLNHRISVDNGLFSLLPFGGGNRRSHALLRGTTAHSAWIDEATLCDPVFVDTADERCSFGDSRMVLTTNADAPGHWLRERLDAAPPSWVLLESDFWENPHYSDKRRKSLLSRTADSAHRHRSVDNVWAAAEGRIIPLEDEHLLAADAPHPEPWGRVYLDPGTAGTTAALLFVELPDGRQLVADEYYHRGETAGRLTDEQHLRRIAERWHIANLIIDPAGASMRAAASTLGLWPRRARNDFDLGVSITNNALYGGRLVVSRRCRRLIAEAASVVWNRRGTDVEPGQPDHALDCLRYGAVDNFPKYSLRGLA